MSLHYDKPYSHLLKFFIEGDIGVGVRSLVKRFTVRPQQLL
jgi:hypothetical protein